MDSREARPPRTGGSRTWGTLAVVGLFACAASAALIPLDNNDIWIHLTTGRLILEEGSVPTADRYSFTAEGARYVAHEWLAAVWYAWGERLAGAAGVVALAKLLPALALMALLLLAVAAVGAPPGIALPVPLLALAVEQRRLSARPELLALPLLLAALWLLWRDRQAARAGRRTRALWLLVPLEGLWANLHGSFPLGPVVVAVFALAALAERWLAPRDARARRVRATAVALAVLAAVGLAAGAPADFGPTAAVLVLAAAALLALDGWWPVFRTDAAGAGQGPGRLLALAGAMAAVIVLNPRGPEIYAFPFEFTAAENLITLSVNEWKPLFGADHLERGLALASYWTFAAAWCAALALAVRRARLGWLELGLLLSLGLLPLRHARWMGLFALASAPALVSTLAAARRGEGASAGPPRWAGAALAGASLVCAVRGAAAALGPPVDPALAAAWALAAVPVAAAVALAARPSAPERLGRAAAGAGALGLALLSLAHGIPELAGLPPRRPGAEAPAAGFGPSLHGRPATDFLRRSGLGGRLFTEYEWAGYAIHELWPRVRVFIDSRSEVYGEPLLREYRAVKRDPELAREALARHGVDLVLVRHRPYPIGRQTNPGVLAAVRGDPGWTLLFVDDRSLLYARRAAGRALPEPLGLFAPQTFRLDAPDLGRPAFEADVRRALERAPHSAFLRLALAESLRAQGRRAEALAELERGWAENPYYAATAQRAGELEAAAGRSQEARRWFERARAAAPGWERPRRALEAAGP